MRSRSWITPAALVCLALTQGVAQGSFSIEAGNNPQTDENVLLTNNQSGTSIFGTTNQTGFDVRFTATGSQTLVSQGSGQASISASSGDLLGLNEITLPGAYYSSLIFDAFNGSGQVAITVTGIEPDGSTATPVTQSFDLGNGENFFTITAGGGELIGNVSISAPGGFGDLRQVRIGGAAVPEPASVVLVGLGGVGLIYGLGTRRRLRHAEG